MLELPAPAVLLGDLLSSQLEGAGLPTRVVLSGQRVELSDLVPADQEAANAVLAGHADAARTALDESAARSANESTIRQRAAAALQGNRDFLTLQAPTNAEVLAQVRALARQNQGLIRLALRRFDGSD